MSEQLPIAEAGVATIDEVRRQWLKVGLPLAVGLAVLAVAFAPEIAAAVQVWSYSTAFNHCFLVLPVAAYLLYERRDIVAAAVPRPAPLIAIASVPVALGWFLAERAGIMEARQLLAMLLVQILVMAAIGPRIWRRLSAPLLYLFFLIPMGEYATPWLQSFTVHFVDAGLSLLRIPHFIDGIGIEIPEGRFYIAEACAGLRFLIASVAFGAFYGCVVYVSPVRRLLFLAASLVVPVIANGFRALGIIVLGHLIGSAEAAAVDHVLYGWIFFSIVTALLILVGLPFRQTRRTVPPRTPSLLKVRAGAAATAAVIVAIAAISPRLLADRLDGAAAFGSGAAQLDLPIMPPAGCSPVQPADTGILQSIGRSDEAALTRNYRCANGTIALRLFVFPPRAGAGPVFTAFRGTSFVPGWEEVALNTRRFNERGVSQTWRISDLSRPGYYASVASTLWIDGRPSSGGMSTRFRLAGAALRGADVPPVVAVVATGDESSPRSSDAAIERFLRDAGGLAGLVSPSASRAQTAIAAPR